MVRLTTKKSKTEKAAAGSQSPSASPRTIDPASTAKLYNLLAKLSAGDSWHDFHKEISGVGKIIRQNEEKYISGLPGGSLYEKFEDEDIALDSVISNVNGNEVDNFGDMLTSDPIFTDFTNIVTVNGNQYFLYKLQCNIKNKTY